MVKAKELKQVNCVLISSLSIIYIVYLTIPNKISLAIVLAGGYVAGNLLTKESCTSMLIAVVATLCLEIVLRNYETWTVYSGSVDVRSGGNLQTDYLKYPFDSTRSCAERCEKEDCKSGTGCMWNEPNKSCSLFEGFKGNAKKKKRLKKRRKRKELFRADADDDDVNEDYIDLGSSFLEAYKSLTPSQIKKMSSDTKNLMNHQKRLIETLDNLGPVIKGGKRVMEQFKHYFADEI